MMNSSQGPQTPSPNSLAHALALYEKARALSTYVKPLDDTTAKNIVETANDAIREFGNTNQEKKVALRRMIKEAEEVLPPATIAELRKRAEEKAIKTLHPKGARLRKFFYAVIVLLLLGVPTVLSLKQFLKSPDDSVYIAPTPTSASPVKTPPEFKSTPTPTPTPPTAEQGAGEATGTRPTPEPAGLGVMNRTAQWVRLGYNVDWRVTGITTRPKATRLDIEVRNTHTQNDEDFFAFTDHPLVIIDGKGGFHKMLWTSEAPEGVRQENKRWFLQAGRVIRVTVDFTPLDPDTETGQVVYETDNRAEPAKFSLDIVRGVAR
jgi:hypothetical protein